MKIFETDELKRKIKAGALAPVYFLYGNESYLINHYTELVVKNCVTALPEINLRIFDSEFDINEISSILYQVPMLSNKKCVILSDYDLSKATAKDLEILKDIIEHPSDVAVLIFKFTSIELSFDNKYKSQKLNKNFKTIADLVAKSEGMVVRINHLSAGDTVKTIISGATRRQCTISPDVARYMIEYCSADLTTLLSELEKLCSYVGSGNIEKATINKICSRSINAVIYDMSKAILANDINRSLFILDDLLYQKNKEVDLLREISKSYIDIFRMHSAHSSNVSVKDVGSDFDYGARSFVLNTASSLAHKLSVSQIEKSLELITNTDLMLKGGSRMNKGDILRMLITQLVVVAAKGDAPC